MKKLRQRKVTSPLPVLPRIQPKNRLAIRYCWAWRRSFCNLWSLHHPQQFNSEDSHRAPLSSLEASFCCNLSRISFASKAWLTWTFFWRHDCSTSRSLTLLPVWKFFEVVFAIFRILLSSNFILWVHLETRFWCAKFWSCNTHHDAGCIELIRPIEAVGSTFTLGSAQIICQGMTLWSPGMTGNIVPNPILSWFVRQIHILLGVEEIQSTLLVRSGKDQALFYCRID